MTRFSIDASRRRGEPDQAMANTPYLTRLFGASLRTNTIRTSPDQSRADPVDADGSSSSKAKNPKIMNVNLKEIPATKTAKY